MKDVLLVGAGYMAKEYAKVLHGLKQSFVVVGRGEESAKKFEQETGEAVMRGGVSSFIAGQTAIPSHAIVAVGIKDLYGNALDLLKAGVKHILLEKPGSLRLEEFQKLTDEAKKQGSEVSIAYNRRFYASTRAAKRYIEEDGGVASFNFEFTEWLHVFEEQGRLRDILPHLFLANSSHVADLAFFLGGEPTEFSCYRKESSQWKDIYTSFAGAGKTKSGALFCYQANWEAPGRWAVEILTNRRRLIFRPLEKLQIQRMKGVQTFFADVDYSFDEDYKPGLYLETQSFLEKNELFQELCSLKEQMNMIAFYRQMAF